MLDSGKKEVVIQFTDELIKIWSRYVENSESEIYSYELSPDGVNTRIRNGDSAIDFEKLKLKEKFLKNIFYDYLSLLKQVEGIEEDLKILEERFSEQIKDLSVLTLNLLKRNHHYFRELEEKSGIGADILLFFAENILRPALMKIADDVYEYIDDGLWRKKYCPVCGWEPAFGIIRKEDGVKFLFCSLCGMKWQFKRIQCPWCLNDDHKKLGFLNVNSGGVWRIDVCEECKGFIRVMNERMGKESIIDKLGKSDFYRLEVESKFLDDLAIAKGYKNKRNLIN